MTTMEKIKKEIISLPYKDRVTLSKWFSSMDRELWDKQIEEDFREGGKGHILLNKIKDDFNKGNCMRWD